MVVAAALLVLGGLALAVGMLVDDATVEIENIHRNHAMHKPLVTAILDGASQIATPTLVGTLSICIVFFPVVLLYLPYLHRRELFDEERTEKLMRNLVYVGLTRAMDCLNVFVLPQEDRILTEVCQAFNNS